jgi:hypothetical protein
MRTNLMNTSINFCHLMIPLKRFLLSNTHNHKYPFWARQAPKLPEQEEDVLKNVHIGHIWVLLALNSYESAILTRF